MLINIMNLQLNPEQALALYELIIASTAATPKKDIIIKLDEVKNKIQILIAESLNTVYSSKNDANFSTWSKYEKSKISLLNEELEKIKSSQKNIELHSSNDDGLAYPPVKE